MEQFLAEISRYKFKNILAENSVLMFAEISMNNEGKIFLQ